MLFSFTDEECPHQYFPENPEIAVVRRVVQFDGQQFGYLDFYNTEDTTYFMTLYIEPAFRDGQWFQIIQEHGHVESGGLPTDVITADLKEKRVLNGVSTRLMEVFRSGNSFVTNHENDRGNINTHYVTGAESLVVPQNLQP